MWFSKNEVEGRWKKNGFQSARRLKKNIAVLQTYGAFIIFTETF